MNIVSVALVVLCILSESFSRLRRLSMEGQNIMSQSKPPTYIEP